MSFLQGPVLFVVLLGVLITVHELGHFLVAKALNVKVLRFSIGFGPKIFGFTRGETEYQVAWLPLGGYVKMAGELPSDEVNPEDAKRGFLAQPPWKRALIVIAGPLFNLVFPVILYFFLFVGPQQRVSPLIRYVQPGSPAAAAGLHPGDRVLAVEGEPVKTFEQVQQKLDERQNEQTELTVQRDGKSITRTLTPASTFEVSPDMLDSGSRGRVGISPQSPPPVLGVPQGSVADQAGLRTFDRVVSIDGKPVTDLTELQKQVADTQGPLQLQVARAKEVQLPGAPITEPELIPVTVPRQPGEGLAALGAENADLYLSYVYPGSPAAKAGLKPGDRLVSVNGTPLHSFQGFQMAVGRSGKQPFHLVWRSQGQTHEADLAPGRFEMTRGETSIPVVAVGVTATPPLAAAEKPNIEHVTIDVGPWAALVAAGHMVPENTMMLVKVLGRLVTRDLSLDTMSGPIGIYQMTSKSAEAGPSAFFMLMALISINLGVVNLLPIPILDGFGLLSAIWEGIRRRPIPMRAREIANLIGLALLVLLMVRVFYNDISRL